MKEHFLGTFYGNEIVLKSDKDIDWSSLYENWLSNQKNQAVQEYKDSLVLRELEVKSKQMEKTFWYKFMASITR